MSKFFALIDRMKYIERWGLMRSAIKENVAEHTLEVAVIAHCLAVVGNKKFGKNYDVGKIAAIAIYHESSEVLTGDLPAPIKYNNPSIRDAYKALEHTAVEKLLAMLPEELTEDYRELMTPSEEEYRLVKVADKISALIKCIDELKCGNAEFKEAKKMLEREIANYRFLEAEYFCKTFLPAFELTLDELSETL